MSALGLVLVGLVIAVGLVGILLPVLPGGLLVFGAIAVWAIIERSTVGWVTLGIAAEPCRLAGGGDETPDLAHAASLAVP